MIIKVITEAGFEFTYDNNMEAFEMVQYIREVSPEEKIRIEVE